MFYFSYDNQPNLPQAGKYQTADISYPMRKVLELQHTKDVKSQMIMYLNLKEDRSFVLGSCNNQVWLAGNYLYEDDSLTFLDIYDFKGDSAKNSIRLFVGENGKTIHYLSSYDSSYSYFDRLSYSQSITVLRLGDTKYHYGFLRNENMTLDSLKRNNKFLPWEEQKIYVDSVIKTLEN
jgi:hypothetical protein